MLRWLRLTQRSGASGSPRIASSINPSSAATRPGWRSVSRLRPAPQRRMPRPISLRAAFSSATPRLIVLRASPLAAATAVTPPRPSDIASLAANSRRPRSSRNGDILSNRVRMLLTSITTTRYRYAPSYPNDILILSLRSLDRFDSIISRQVLSTPAPSRKDDGDVRVHYRYRGNEKVFDHSAEAVVLGRPRHGVHVDIDLTPDLRVSRPHARISVADGHYWIEDLGSANGTELGGEQIKGKGKLRL